VNTGCELGHPTHDTIEVDTVQGKFTVFDTAQYMDRPGWYCPGQDTVSQNIGIHGQWEPTDSAVIGKILADGDKRHLVIDFGAMLAGTRSWPRKLGYRVIAIDGDTENLRLLRTNVAAHGIKAKVKTIHGWVDEQFCLPTLRALLAGVELVKIDLEANDRFAVEACWPFIDRIRNFYVEISPIFRPDYPEMVNRLTGAGFTAFYPDGRVFDDDYTTDQFNLRFSRA
jgi:hypothetical protein